MPLLKYRVPNTNRFQGNYVVARNRRRILPSGLPLATGRVPEGPWGLGGSSRAHVPLISSTGKTNKRIF